MIVFWGIDVGVLKTGGRYNPATDSWTATNNIGVGGKSRHTAIWTGTEMIVWGGATGGVFSNSGYSYNPSTDSWTSITTTAAPDGRFDHTAIWTGTEMIVWGGTIGNTELFTGGRFSFYAAPSTKSIYMYKKN